MISGAFVYMPVANSAVALPRMELINIYSRLGVVDDSPPPWAIIL